MEEKVQELEKSWAAIQERALKQPSPGPSLHQLSSYIKPKKAMLGSLISGRIQYRFVYGSVR